MEKSGPQGLGKQIQTDRELLQKAGYLSIIIPALNEERRLPGAIVDIYRFLQFHGAEFEVIVVDDGSMDGTTPIVERLQPKYRELRLIRFLRNQGKGAAVKAGMLEAKGNFMLFTDADQATTIDQLPGLLYPMVETGFDIAIGSRGARDARILIGQTWYRKIAARVFGYLTKFLLVRGFRDCQCGFKCFRRAARDEIFPRMTCPTALFDMEILLLAARQGLRVAEVPVVWKHDPDSRLTYNLSKSIGLLRELLRIRRTWNVTIPAKAKVTILRKSSGSIVNPRPVIQAESPQS